MMTKMHIETSRLQIRNFTAQDFLGAYAYLSDPNVMYFLPESTMSETQTAEFITQQSRPEAHYYAVERKSDNALLGHLLFEPYFGEHTYEIGWVFHRDAHRQGYASESAAAMLDYGFHQLKLHRVIATCQPENPGSYKVMEKIGMRREGLFLQCIPTAEGQWWDEYYYAILRQEWLNQQASSRR